MTGPRPTPAAPAPADLAGALCVRPGQPGRALQSSRREWAPRLARGRPAAALPGLLSAVYALCGGAHRWTAAAAVAAAQGADTAPTAADRAALRADTLREHLRRIWLDWPRTLPVPGGAPEAAGLAACPLIASPLAQAPDAVAASRPWVEQALLGQPAAAWWAGWQQGGAAFVRGWARETDTPVARWLHDADAVLDGLAVPCQLLGPPLGPGDGPAGAAADTEGALRRLAARLRDEPGHALAPDWLGTPCETGPWARVADRAALSPAGAAAAAVPRLEAFHRLAARLAEAAVLVTDAGVARLAQGALAVAPGEGLAWCEMARGLLVHWVQLRAAPGADGAAVVEQCRVLAPTEWNFHPRGALAEALAALPTDAPEPIVRVLAAAFDPCVALTVERPGAAAPMPNPAVPGTAFEETRCTR